METVELSCSSCKSRRNLIMLTPDKGMGFDVKCQRHYTEYLQTKIIRLSEFIDANKKEVRTTEETPKEDPKVVKPKKKK